MIQKMRLSKKSNPKTLPRRQAGAKVAKGLRKDRKQQYDIFLTLRALRLL